jgi:hypothetical protein
VSDTQVFTPEQDFWQWFLSNEERLYTFDPDDVEVREKLFDELSAVLERVGDHLCFEFGPPEEKREFVISADGIKDGFPAVVALKKTAPRLDRWEIIAFRPRRCPMPVIENNVTIDPADVEFSLFTEDDVPGIQLFLPGMPEVDAQKTYRSIGYLLLDQALGEYDVETAVGPIEMVATPSEAKPERFPLRELPRMFDELLERIAGKSVKPS